MTTWLHVSPLNKEQVLLRVELKTVPQALSFAWDMATHADLGLAWWKRPIAFFYLLFAVLRSRSE